MKITIHRGTNQIGGCVTEIESNGYKIFIDFGEQLPGSKKIELKPIVGLTTGDLSKSALFFTHYHGDHIGKLCETNDDLTFYIGETALDIYSCLEKRLSHIPDEKEAIKHKRIIERLSNARTFKAKDKIKVGEITVIPLFTDHSAFDAYMFVIEADGKRILHTGDFRGHGFRRKGLIPTLEIYAQNIDYIISEGSNIDRDKLGLKSEKELQKDFEEQFRKYKYNFVFVSSTNIDRIFSLYHAAKATGRCFVCDSYQTEILKIVTDSASRYTDFYKIDYLQKKKPAGRYFELTRKWPESLAFKGRLKSYLENHGFCMLIRANDAFKQLLDEYKKMQDSQIYYSMWLGYLDENKEACNEDLIEFFKPYRYNYLHTSGHADIQTLKSVFETVIPKKGIIPMHTDKPEKFIETFADQNVILLEDGKEFDCD